MAVTSATSPSLEDLTTQSMPGTPRIVLHIQLLAYHRDRLPETERSPRLGSYT